MHKQFTKDFYVKVGHETKPDIVKAIARREMLGDKIDVNIYYIQDESGVIHKINEEQAETIKNNIESQD